MEQVVQKSIMDSGMEAARTVAARVRDLVDDDFRAHCKVAVASNGTISIVVDHPGRVYAMRSRWLAPFSKVLSQSDRSLSGSRIRFEYGSHGVVL